MPTTKKLYSLRERFAVTVFTAVALLTLTIGTAQATLLVQSKALADGTSPDSVVNIGIVDAEATLPPTDVAAFGISALAKSHTEYRLNKALATTTDSSVSEGVVAQSESFWREGLTLLGDANITPTAAVNFQFQLTGSLGGNTQSSNVNFEFIFDTFDDYCCSDSVSFFSRDAGIFDETISLLVTFPVATLTPVYISGHLQATAGTGGSEIGPAVADFFGTATLTEVTVPGGLTLVSESGTDYSTNIPEPTTLSIAIVLLTGIAIRQRRRV